MPTSRMNGEIVDLFAGPGGWDHAAHQLGVDPLGIEWDDAAVATRKAVGYRTEQADVAALDPAASGSVTGLIASPPCQAWSMAGKRGGERDKGLVYLCADDLARGADNRHHAKAACEDPRSMLVVEPVRWVDKLRPQWVALEQVPPVLELWQHFAWLFRHKFGYSAWTGIVNAADYGVPQTRERAILLARLDGPVLPPEPTHCRGGSDDSMFGPGLAPWVSMSQALGWNGAVQEFQRGQGMIERHGERPGRAMEEPSFTILAGNAGSGTRLRWVQATAHRLSVADAAALQSFPPDYPWQGTRSKQFEQIGNAIPPRLALHLLSAVTGIPLPLEVRAA